MNKRERRGPGWQKGACAAHIRLRWSKEQSIFTWLILFGQTRLLQEKYRYAFGVENFYDVDDRINEGDEFNFEVVETGNKNGVNCAAAYPYPQKRLNIKVLEVFRKH